MPSIKIPESDRPRVQKLARLGEDQRHELLNVLQNREPTMVDEESSVRLAEQVKSIDAAEVGEVMETLRTLYGVKSYLNLAAEDFVELVSKSRDLDLSESERVQFGEFLNLALNADPVVVASKALQLLYEHANTLHSVRILTDLRPVFSDNTVEAFTAAVITHTLKLQYHHGTQIEELFLAIDSDDLKTLRDLLDRAEAKAKTIENTLGSSGVVLFS